MIIYHTKLLLHHCIGDPIFFVHHRITDGPAIFRHARGGENEVILLSLAGNPQKTSYSLYHENLHDINGGFLQRFPFSDMAILGDWYCNPIPWVSRMPYINIYIYNY